MEKTNITIEKAEPQQEPTTATATTITIHPIDINGDIVKRKPKGNSRLLLFSCGCGCKVRTARNENKPLMAVCEYCDTEFKEVVKEPIKPTLTTSESLAFKHESEVKK